jgi:hypothetical protein
LVEGRYRDKVAQKRGKPKCPFMKSERLCDEPRTKKVEGALSLVLRRPIYKFAKTVFDDPGGNSLIQPKAVCEMEEAPYKEDSNSYDQGKDFRGFSKVSSDR